MIPDGIQVALHLFNCFVIVLVHNHVTKDASGNLYLSNMRYEESYELSIDIN